MVDESKSILIFLSRFSLSKFEILSEFCTLSVGFCLSMEKVSVVLSRLPKDGECSLSGMVERERVSSPNGGEGHGDIILESKNVQGVNL